MLQVLKLRLTVVWSFHVNLANGTKSLISPNTEDSLSAAIDITIDYLSF